MSAPRAGSCGAIRRATLADLDDVTQLWIALTQHHAVLDPHFRLRPGAAAEIRELLRAQLRDPGALVLLDAAAGASPSGFCVARHDAAPPIHDETGRIEISDLWVDPARRGRGRGRALVAAAFDWARARGVRRIEVRVSAHNPEGRAFWRALGFAAFVDVLDLRL